jgi:hypothetical protein
MSEGKRFEDEEIKQHSISHPIKKKWHIKHKRKLTILFAYQLSNLGWIGTCLSFVHDFNFPLFAIAASLICLADIFILWKDA